MSGRAAADIEKLCGPDIIKTDTITYFLSPENAETFPDLIKRAEKVLEFVNSRHTDQSILLSGHGDMGKMIYTAFYKENWEDILRNFHFGNCELLLLDNDCPPDKRHVLKLDQFNH